MTLYNVATTPVQVQTLYGSNQALQNNGPGNIWLGNDTSVSPSTGFLVQPGVSFQLNNGADIWAVSDNQAQVAIMSGIAPSSATIIEVNGTVQVGQVTLAPNTVVGISGPVTVEGTVQISGTPTVNINGTVPVDISSGTVTANLAAGSVVDINSGTVNIGNTPAVTPQAMYAALWSTTQSWAPGDSTSYGSGVLAIGAYSTLTVAVKGSKSAQPYASDGLFKILLQWYSDAAGTQNVAQEQWVWWEAAAGSITVPVIAEYVKVSMAPSASSGAVETYTETATALASTVPQERKYECIIDPALVVNPPPGYFADENGFGATGAPTSSTIGPVPLTHVSGDAIINYYNAIATSGTGVIELRYYVAAESSGAAVARYLFIDEQSVSVSTVMKGTQKILLPEAPISMQLSSTATYNVETVHRHQQSFTALNVQPL